MMIYDLSKMKTQALIEEDADAKTFCFLKRSPEECQRFGGADSDLAASNAGQLVRTLSGIRDTPSAKSLRVYLQDSFISKRFGTSDGRQYFGRGTGGARETFSKDELRFASFEISAAAAAAKVHMRLREKTGESLLNRSRSNPKVEDALC